MQRKMARCSPPRRGTVVVIVRAEGQTLADLFPGARPVGLRDPHPEHIGKRGVIVGATESGVPIIELGDGTLLQGSECWWRTVPDAAGEG